VKGEVLSQSQDPDRAIEHVSIGAMQPRQLIERVGPGSLLIIPGDRTDVIQAVVAVNRASRDGTERRSLFGRRRQVFGRAAESPATTELAGFVLTGGYRPRPRDLEAIRGEGMFALLVDDDTYEAASQVHDLLVKTHPADRDKIELIRRLVSEHIDIDSILARFTVPGHQVSRSFRPARVASLAARAVRGFSGMAGRAARSR
jgi:BioD-like phosphotransacetylase family protein